MSDGVESRRRVASLRRGRGQRGDVGMQAEGGGGGAGGGGDGDGDGFPSASAQSLVMGCSEAADSQRGGPMTGRPAPQ